MGRIVRGHVAMSGKSARRTTKFAFERWKSSDKPPIELRGKRCIRTVVFPKDRTTVLPTQRVTEEFKMSDDGIVFHQYANHVLGLYVQFRANGESHESALARAEVGADGWYAFVIERDAAKTQTLASAANAFIGEVDAMRSELKDVRTALLAAQTRIGELTESLALANAEITELRPEPTPADMGIIDETDATTSSDARESSQGEAQEQD